MPTSSDISMVPKARATLPGRARSAVQAMMVGMLMPMDIP